MAHTVPPEDLHASFRFYYDRQNAQLMPTVDAEGIDLLLNYAQRQIQGDEYRAWRAPNGKGFEEDHERKRNLQAFVNADPVVTQFSKEPTKGPFRMPFPKDHRYTVSAEVSWVGLPDVFYPIRPFSHDSWRVAQQDAHQKAVYWDPAMVMHENVEELLPVEGGHCPDKAHIWYVRLPQLISLEKGQGMELPEWFDERLVNEAVARGKFIAEVAGADFQQALRQMTI